MKDPLQLLLTDVEMPGMNGRALAAEIRALHPDIRVLYVTAHTDDLFAQGGLLGAGEAFLEKPATPAELDRMRALAEEAMLAGAFGLSTGLFYVPGTFTPTEEVIELARVVGRLGGIHVSHMRNEAASVVESVRETIRIGEEGGRDGITFYGSSFVSDPYGRVLVQAPRDEPAVLVADLDLDRRTDWLELFPFLTTRRPDAYGPLT